MGAKPLQFEVSQRVGQVSALELCPADAHARLVLAHGAGADMRHAFMENLAELLAARGIATFRYQFPYTEKGRRRPDPPGVLRATVRAAVTAATQAANPLPLFAGGKSMGGRMTSLEAAERDLPGVRGIVFFGFPLHAPGKTGAERGEHLREVPQPLLFLQGTRDPLADLQRLRPLCDSLGNRAQLHIVDGGDHSFHMLKRSGRSDADALDELAETTTAWVRGL